MRSPSKVSDAARRIARRTQPQPARAQRGATSQHGGVVARQPALSFPPTSKHGAPAATWRRWPSTCAVQHAGYSTGRRSCAGREQASVVAAHRAFGCGPPKPQPSFAHVAVRKRHTTAASRSRSSAVLQAADIELARSPCGNTHLPNLRNEASRGRRTRLCSHSGSRGERVCRHASGLLCFVVFLAFWEHAAPPAHHHKRRKRIG